MRTTRMMLSALAVVLLATAAPADDPPVRRRTKVKIDLPALLELHNKARADAKLGPLVFNDKLNAAAKGHAKDMADHHKMTHEGSDGSDASARVKRQGYGYQLVGENVAEGQSTAREVMRDWMNSPHHKENILRPEFTEVGMACVVDDDGMPYWCVDFGKPWPKIDPVKGAAAMLEALNAARDEQKKPPLETNDTLQDAAEKHARAMAEAGKFLTKDPDGEAPTARAQKAGYAAKTIAQNDAIGHVEAARAVKSWLDSEGSRKVLMGDFRDIGIGVGTDKEGVPYWCVIVGQPRKPRGR